MKTVIILYSQHHQNTKKLVDAIRKENPEVEIIDILKQKAHKLEEYDRIGVASGIYYSTFAKPMLEYLKAYLPEHKTVFALYTCGQNRQSYTKAVKALVQEKKGIYLGEYGCLGFDTFGPFKLIGGLKKGHPTAEEIRGAVDFYRGL